MNWRELVCWLWRGNKHKWQWVNSVNEKEPSGWRCSFCKKRG